MDRRSRRIAATLLLCATLAGCALTNDITTNDEYAASDGVRHELGDLVMSNLLILTTDQGAPGTVLGAVSNHGKHHVQVTLRLTGQDLTTLDLPPGRTTLLGPRHHPVDVDAVPEPPGALVELEFHSGRYGRGTAHVPVLDDTIDYYNQLMG